MTNVNEKSYNDNSQAGDSRKDDNLKAPEKKTITAIVTDTHIGGTTALCLPEWSWDTGEMNEKGEPIRGSYKASRAQLWILESWLDYWEHVKKLAGKEYRIITVHVGDVVDGDHHQTLQAIPNVEDQEALAIEVMKPVANLGPLYFIRGTGAHSGEMSRSEVRIAKELGAKSCTWELLLSVDGVLMDFAHHGRAGRRDWTSSAASMATEAVMDAAKDGRQIPRYVFRGHNHIIDDSGEKVPGTRAVALPSWQLRTEYGYKASPGRRSDIGGLIVLPDGSLDTSRMRYTAAPGQRKITYA